ncbi:DUF1707 domain-containing protein [Rhodococcus fascians]|uniref:DUF1707 domain-containing protein n=1 Tax=Rhodococcoides fascians TaxID=1828 RepID=A0A143QQG4_RHOFA|nr:DUF1707 domain-containing protein [Rhodococcus fascians]AMY24627.1 hypothetical protein A3Q41_03336 [Rhodococcus fascians]KMJ47995.1 membrane protein [Rhodococcus fascians]MBM7245015.1 DUF1707 domain-containing protein [Rhodococcus fascians]MBY3810948.1 DUF1707 domain-containing protein [Rhodococcus fascians]MBY3842139.1 DUF1707 domain-containing protein [Rhodococcus fascians]
MSELPEIRIGTADREKALDVLGQHFSEGRLTVPEFDERSATIASATTRGQLESVFVDLPAASGTASVARSGTDAPAVKDRGIDWAAVVMPIVIFGSLALFFLTDFDQKWLFFLLIPLAGAILSAVGHPADKKKKKKKKR